MRVRNISKIVLYYVKIHRKHIGKTIVVHNLYGGSGIVVVVGVPMKEDRSKSNFKVWVLTVDNEIC